MDRGGWLGEAQRSVGKLEVRSGFARGEVGGKAVVRWLAVRNPSDNVYRRALPSSLRAHAGK
jgi:hypothetical protein